MMTNRVSTGEAPSNSELRKIGQDAIDALKYSFTVVAAEQTSAVREGSLEKSMQAGFAAMRPERRDRFETGAKSLLKMSKSQRRRTFGRYGGLGPNEFRKAGFDRAHEVVGVELKLDHKLAGLPVRRLNIPASAVVRRTPAGLVIPMAGLGFEGADESALDLATRKGLDKALENGLVNGEKLKDIWGLDLAPDLDGFGDDEAGFEESGVLTKLGMWITRVKCVDETNPEWWGDDEFAVGGTSIDEDGDTQNLGETYLGGGWHDGRQKTYSNWRFTWFNLQEGESWPKTYQLIFLAAEKDNGGFSSFLSDVYDRVRSLVMSAVSKLVGIALTPCLGPIIGQAIGTVVAWVVDVFISWIISWWEDDPFPAHVASVTHAGWGARWTVNGTWGSTSSPLTSAHFYGHGGHYLIDYYWKLFN
jgi:hypothetical protein